MGKTLQLFLFGTTVAAALSLAPAQASAANCSFSKKEKIAMVSWVMIIPGAVITALACKRDLFTKKEKSAAVLPSEDRNLSQTRVLDRRRKLGV
jgi:hypothetical protein